MKIEIYDDLMCPGCANFLVLDGSNTIYYKIGVYYCSTISCTDCGIKKIYNPNVQAGPAMININQFLAAGGVGGGTPKINPGAGGAKGSTGGSGGRIYLGGSLGLPKNLIKNAQIDPIKISCPTCYSKIELNFEEATEMHKQTKNCKCPNCGTQGHYMSEEFRQRIWKELQK